MDANLIDAAIIGTGRIASILEDDILREKPCTHAGALIATGACRIAAGMDIDPERNRQFSRRWGVASFDDAERMLAETDPQIVVIATHPDSHEQYVRLAAKRCVPVLVCEKPLAHTWRSAARIAAIERDSASRILINHERRFSSDYRIVKDAVHQRRFGDLLGISARLYFGRTAARDRVLLHDGTHLIDAIHFLTGDLIQLNRRQGGFRSCHPATLLYGRLTQQDVPVSIEIGSRRDYLHLEIELSFSGGMIRIGNGVFSWQRSLPSPFYERYRSLMEMPRNVPQPTGYFLNVMNEAVRLVRDPSAVSRSTAADALKTIRVIRRARRFFP